MSVAEGYYIKEAAQVLQGRVVKTPRLTGVCVLDCELELLNPPTGGKNKHSLWSIVETTSFL